MATSQTVTRDALSTYDRLFCHRPALQGEIKYFVREMEGKRNDRELARLKEVQAKVEKIDRALPECEELALKRLENLQASIDRATEHAATILSEKVDEDQIRSSLTEKREQEWVQFTKEMGKAKEDVEKIHKERMAKLEHEIQEHESQTQ